MSKKYPPICWEPENNILYLNSTSCPDSNGNLSIQNTWYKIQVALALNPITDEKVVIAPFSYLLEKIVIDEDLTDLNPILVGLLINALAPLNKSIWISERRTDKIIMVAGSNHIFQIGDYDVF